MTATYLGMPARTAAAIAAAALLVGAAIGTILPTPAVGVALPSANGCTVVADGPTGPEPEVTLAVAVLACPDGRYAVTYVIGNPAEVIDVQLIPSAPCGWRTNGVDVMPAPCPAVHR